MKLVDEIVELAASDDVKLTTILRKCLIVAARLKNDALRTWVESELNGYSDNDSLPSYRVIGLTAKGVFLGGWGAQINDQPLASGVLEEKHRHWATTGNLKEPVSSYEMLASEKTDGVAIVNWPADMVGYYQSKFMAIIYVRKQARND